MSFRSTLFSRMRESVPWFLLHILCSKLDDGFASVMRSRYLISNTNCAADRRVWTHHPRIHNLTKTHFEPLETPIRLSTKKDSKHLHPSVDKLYQIAKRLNHWWMSYVQKKFFVRFDFKMSLGEISDVTTAPNPTDSPPDIKHHD